MAYAGRSMDRSNGRNPDRTNCIMLSLGRPARYLGKQASSVFSMAFRGRRAGLTLHFPGSLANDLLLLLWPSFYIISHYNKILVRFNAQSHKEIRHPELECLTRWSGPEGSRTPDLLNAIEARSQLRYRPSSIFLGAKGFYTRLSILSRRKISADSKATPDIIGYA